MATFPAEEQALWETFRRLRALVQRLGRDLRAGWEGASASLRFKPGLEALTDADLEIEHRLRGFLSRRRPGDGLLGEEEGATAGRGPWTWILDPLDGTSNYALGIPFFCIAVGLLHRGRPWAGLIHDPLRRETFWAWPGRGAFLGRRGLPLVRRKPPRLREALVAIHATRRPDAAAALRRLRRLLPACRTLRFLGTGSLELAYLAAGRLDAVVWHAQPEAFLHDLAPGQAIATLAGVQVHRLDSEATRRWGTALVAAREPLLAEILQRLP
jgi:myo-inositol-1(or 4)-monophosphatase